MNLQANYVVIGQPNHMVNLPKTGGTLFYASEKGYTLFMAEQNPEDYALSALVAMGARQYDSFVHIILKFGKDDYCEAVPSGLCFESLPNPVTQGFGHSLVLVQSAAATNIVTAIQLVSLNTELSNYLIEGFTRNKLSNEATYQKQCGWALKSTPKQHFAKAVKHMTW